MLAQRARSHVAGPLFPQRRPCACRCSGGWGLVTAVECISHQSSPAPAPAPAPAPRSVTKHVHAHACSVQHMQASLPYSCDIILTASPSLRPEAMALTSTTPYATQLWASHAKLCVRLRAMSWDPKLGTLHYETTICTWESNWVYVQSAAVHPCSSSLSPLLLLAVCVCRNPRLLLSVACHLLALLHQAVRGRSCLGSRLGAGGRRVRCLGVLVVDFASFSAC